LRRRANGGLAQEAQAASEKEAMSELTQCNYCSLRRIRRDAKREKKRVTILSDARWGMGGVNVYVHPRDVNVSRLRGGEDGPRREYFVSWFMQLTQHCCC
jgi:hypothetical protein